MQTQLRIGLRSLRLMSLAAAVGLIMGCTSLPGRIVSGDSFGEHEVVTLDRPVVLSPGGSLDCGAEALHSVFRYHGTPSNLEDLCSQLYVPGVAGTFPHKLIQVARCHGFAVRSIEGSATTLRAAIDAGCASIILARMNSQANHYMLPTGYSPENGWFVCEFYQGQKWILSEAELDEVWRPCGYMQLEFTPDAAAADLAAARLQEEHGELAGALLTYRRVLAIAPDHIEGRIGAGNCLALQHAYTDARSEYRLAYEAGSRAPELLNNLADVSLALGDNGADVLAWAGAAVDGYSRENDRECTELRRAVLAHKLALALGTLAAIHRSRGELDSARDCYQRSLDLLPPEAGELRTRRQQQISDCHLWSRGD